MRLVSKDKLQELQKRPSTIRNICIMAHVDHGKTTLADSLVASNGIISPRLAGKLRYMDSRKDEQERGITMKSSSIALFHSLGESKEFLINLIDSPGHVDFSSEVSTAVRLCDGAVVLVDVVEGVCPQTKVSMKQAWEENIKMVLVLNKMDRLIVEMKLTPLDAFIHLTQIMEQVNAVMGELFASSILGKTESAEEAEKKNKGATSNVYDWSSGLEDVDDSNLYFSPDQGNVIFASAVDGWGFEVKHFAKLFSKKINVEESLLEKTLWGDYYFNSKTKQITKGAQIKARKPLFVQLILESLWSLYDTVIIRKEKDKIPKIAENLGIKLSTRDLRHTDCKVQLQAVFSQWLPLATALLDIVCERFPSPLDLSDEKVDKLFCVPSTSFDNLPEETKSLQNAFKKCSNDDEAPAIVFISKMFPVDRKNLPINKQRPLTAEEIAQRRELARQRHAEKLLSLSAKVPDESAETSQLVMQEGQEDIKHEPEVVADDDAFIAFARVFSGNLKSGQQLYVLGPKHDPCKALEKFKDGKEVDPSLTLKDLKSGQHITLATVNELFLLMGRELEALEEAPAGNIIGIGGLEEHVLKSATLSSSIGCPSFRESHSSLVGDMPIFRVAVEPCHPSEMTALVRGLRLLNQADAAVQVLVQETGEHVLATAGEVHLQRCLQDLRERYAKIEINASKPIVPFRETIVLPPKVDMVNEVIQEQNTSVKKAKEDSSDDGGLITITTPNKRSILKIRAVPLPEPVTDILLSNGDIIKAMDKYHDRQKKVEEEVRSKMDKLTLESDPHNAPYTPTSSLPEEMLTAVEDLKMKLKKEFCNAGKSWEGAENNIWSFGPKRCGPNILLNKIQNAPNLSFWSENEAPKEILDPKCEQLFNYNSSFVNGFQLATLAGPLCEEPMMGVCFVVEDWAVLELTEDETGESGATSMPYGPFSGQIMSGVKEACRKAFQAQPQRLMAAMYSCTIQVNAEVLGKLYAVLGRRHGRILAGDITEGSATFSVTAVLPVVESFAFASEIRKQTSGLAISPQLLFSHWEVVDIDPFWVPSTQEEYLHFGDKADADNRARKYVDDVRRRKGLPVERKIVEHAEKQRTLSKNK
ncbi:elongation factor-like GTPase 1 [Hetaerina americana]|uniref:elongation factor-like GTPase 1 n=1 Tax=Hetaerina americana TaxID=62018 RepID=UPI003A7F5565